MLSPHDLIEAIGSLARYRIVWVSPDYTYVYAIDVGDPTSWPERINVEDVLANQAKGVWKVAEGQGLRMKSRSGFA